MFGVIPMSIIFGNIGAFSLKKRILIITTLFAVILSIISAVLSYISNLHSILVIIPIISAVIFFYLFYAAKRTEDTTIISFIYISVCILVLTIVWFYNDGYNSAHSLLIFNATIMSIMITTNRHRVIVFTTYLIMIASLIIIQYYHPELIYPYHSENDRFYDILFSTILNMIIMYSLIKYVLKNYDMEQQKVNNERRKVEEINAELKAKNDHIYASVRYASTIQDAILPWDISLRNAFLDIFVFYKPKDIVSGDSYWFQEANGIKFLATIDCTGHGIPGAMLTVIASTTLDDAVLGRHLTDTAEILTYMNNKVTDVLNQRLAENQIRDGMEVALIAVHGDKIQFSGAGRPLYMKNGTMEIVKTDKRGIAGQTSNDYYQFSSVEISKSEKLMLYLSSDGFADQMDEKSKKYSTRRFIKLLDYISEMPVSEQYEIIDNELKSHRGNREQIDDVTIIGVKL